MLSDCRYRGTETEAGWYPCELVRKIVPADLRPDVHPSVCRACGGNPSPVAPPKPVTDQLYAILLAAGRPMPPRGRPGASRPTCAHLGDAVTLDLRLPVCQRVYRCEAGHGEVTPCRQCQTCPDWERANPAASGKEVWLAGYPGPVGGADTEALALVKLWVRNGIDVNLVPMPPAVPPREAIRAMDSIGTVTHVYRSDIFANRVVVSLCNGSFLRHLPEIHRTGKPRSVVWANCMTWHTTAEVAAVQAGLIDYHLFQTKYQRDRLMPYLRGANRGAEVASLPYRVYFDAGDLRPEPKPTGYFGVGRISRADPNKFHARTWQLFDAILTPADMPKKTFVLGYGEKVAAKVGKPPGSLDWMTWGPGGVPAAEFYRRVHAVCHYTGGSAENLPRILLEAWATGTVFLAEAAYSFGDLIRDGADGFLCRSPEHMAAVASMLAADPARRSEVAEAGREALRRYTDPAASFAEPWAGIL